MKSPVTLVVGASPNSERYSFLATSLLNEHGISVYPYGIKTGMINDIPILNEWPSQIPIDTVTLYLGSAAQTEYIDQILALKPRRIIFNPGTENPDLEKLLKLRGIEFTKACTLVLLASGQY
jgi:predicted CoA-binding protein